MKNLNAYLNDVLGFTPNESQVYRIITRTAMVLSPDEITIGELNRRPENPYGFVESYHGSIYAGSRQVVPAGIAMPANDSYIVGHYFSGNKGNRFSWFCKFEDMDQKTQNKVLPMLNAAAKEFKLEMERERIANEELALKIAKRNEEYRLAEEARIKSALGFLPVYSYKKIRDGNYGCYEYAFKFDNELTEEEFKKFISAKFCTDFEVTPSDGWNGIEYYKFEPLNWRTYMRTNKDTTWTFIHQCHYTD